MYVARKSTPTPLPRRFFRATCSNVYPPGVTAVADTVSSQDSHVSVKHNMSRSWSTTKSAKKSSLVADRSRIQQTQLGRPHVCGQHWDLLLPREESGGLVKVGGRDVIITGILRGLWAPARQPRWVGRWSATPATHAALQAVLFRRVFLLGRSRCKHSDVKVVKRDVKVVKRDVYAALATMVAHDRITMSSVTQVQAGHFKMSTIHETAYNLP